MGEETRVHILYSNISQDLSEEIYKRCLIFLTEPLREKHFRYRRWQDRAANLCSIILLIQGLQKYGVDYRALESLQYTKYGRPYIPGTIDFNISHSGNYVVCAISDGLRVGVDIEQVKPVDFADFKDLMSNEQWTLIRNASDPLQQFFTYWAIKESIIKADGRGLSIPLNDILIAEEMAFYETRWYLKKLEFDESYCAWLASDKEGAIMNVELVDVCTI